MLRRMLENLAEWRRQQRAFEELYSLDDRSLADIGITRSEIPYLLARQPDPAPERSRATQDEALRHAA